MIVTDMFAKFDSNLVHHFPSIWRILPCPLCIGYQNKQHRHGQSRDEGDSARGARRRPVSALLGGDEEEPSVGDGFPFSSSSSPPPCPSPGLHRRSGRRQDLGLPYPDLA